MFETWRQAAILGALVGLVESCAIVRYDWLMDDPRAWRVGAALLWAVLIIAMNAVAFVGLRKLCRGNALALALVWLMPLLGLRFWSGDRFQWWSLLPAVLALLVATVLRRWPKLMGAFAVLLAWPGLWGRVPVFGSPWMEWVEILGPGMGLAAILGALPIVSQVSHSTQGFEPKRGFRMAIVGGLSVIGIAGAAVGFAPREVPEQPLASDRPNVLFVLVDTLRADHVGPYGERATASTRRLAAEGLRFEDAITVIPKTTQSVSAVFTGQYPVHNGVRMLKDPLASEHQTLAEHFQAAGYRTGAFVHNGWVMRGRGFEQGFDQFWSFFEIERAWGPLRLTTIGTVLDGLTVRRIRNFDGNTDAAVMTDLALDWMQQNAGRGEPFFAYLHYFDPHWPYRPPNEDGEIMVNNIRDLKWSRGQMYFQNPLPMDENEKAVDLYGLEVDYNIDQVGRLLDFLDQHGMTDNTIVVFTSDHGHHLGDHDYWFHHGEFLYEPGLQIPLIVRYPNESSLEPGSVEDTQFRNVDLTPTLLDLAGLDVPEGMDGRPLQELREEGAPPAYLETDISYFKMNKRRKVKGTLGNVRAVRDGRWKLHYTPRNQKGKWELYDLESDPEELRNLIKQADPDVLWPLVREIAQHIPEEERAQLAEIGNRFDVLPDGTDPPESALDEGAGGAEDIDGAEADMLDALGYIDD